MCLVPSTLDTSLVSTLGIATVALVLRTPKRQVPLRLILGGLLGNRSNATTTTQLLSVRPRSSRASPTWSTSSSVQSLRSSILTRHHHHYPRHPHPFQSLGHYSNNACCLSGARSTASLAFARPDFESHSLADLT